MCLTLHWEEDVAVWGGRKRSSRFRQQVASRLGGLPGHDLGHGMGLHLGGAPQEHGVFMA